jgi:endonuclease YncB( thermonuclease family)
MPKREVEQHRAPRDVPPVGRPRGAVWRALQADGVVWEGQVYLVGGDVDLASRMIVTHRRVVFARGGDLVLDVPREWLRPEPILRRDGVLDLFVTMPGSNLFDEPMTVPLRMREGHPAAGHIIAMLAPGGVRRIMPESMSGMERAREAAPVPQFNGFWEVDDLDASWDTDPLDPVSSAPESRNDAAQVELSDWLPPEPPDRVVRASSTPAHRPQTNGYPMTGLQPRDQRKSPWGLLLRVFGLVVLLATAAALGAGRLHLGVPGSGDSGAILAGPSPTAAVVASPTAAPEAALLPVVGAAIAMGVGGSTTETTAPGESPAAAVQSATETPQPAAPTATSSPTAVVIPTPAPTSAPVQAAASPISTPEATVASAAPDAATPALSTPDATVAEQPAAVNADSVPAQELVTGPLRLAISSAQRAESLPRYGLPPGSGEWVLLIADIRNEGDDSASLAMGDFRLYDRATGTTIELDSGTDVIAGLAGFDPPRSAADTIAVPPGESAEALLLFLLPPGSSEDVAFLAGDTAMDLAPILAAGEATVAAPPELLQATVSDVLDGARIVVDIAGSEETVQYLGMQAPLADACFATESTAANEQLVAGQTVWLERQASDRGEDSALLRDVWIPGQSGDQVLVSERLLEAGAGTAVAGPPDTRYQAWLQAASALARSNSAGLWGACPDAASA